MTDYLEQLLEDEKETVWTEGRRVAVNPSPERGDRKGENGPEGAHSGLPAAEAAPQERKTAGMPAGEEDRPENEAADWLADRERIAVGLLPPDGRTPEAAAVLLEELARAGRSVRAVRGGTGVVTVTLPGAEARGAGLDLETLDQAARRDARRYDGGFELF